MAYVLKKPATAKYYVYTDADGNFTTDTAATSTTLFTFSNYNATYAGSPNSTNQINAFTDFMSYFFFIKPANDYRRFIAEWETS